MSEKSGEVKSLPESPKIEIGRSAPTFTEVLQEVEADPAARTNLIEAIGQVPKRWGWGTEPGPAEIPEREAIINFAAFLDKLEKGLTGEDKDGVGQFRNDFSLIGEKETAEAIEAMAGKVKDDWEKGKHVLLWLPRGRSEKYITLRMLRLLNDWGIEVKNSRKKQTNPIFIEQGDAPSSVAWEIDRYYPDGVVYLPDDFIVSGTHLRTEAQRVFDCLTAKNIMPGKAAKMIKVLVTAMPKDKRISLEPFPENKEPPQEFPLGGYAHFGVQPSALNFCRACFTGVYAVVDYAFSEVLDPLTRKAGIEKPLLMKIIKPYDSGNWYRAMGEWADRTKGF